MEEHSAFDQRSLGKTLETETPALKQQLLIRIQGMKPFETKIEHLHLKSVSVYRVRLNMPRLTIVPSRSLETLHLEIVPFKPDARRSVVDGGKLYRKVHYDESLFQDIDGASSRIAIQIGQDGYRIVHKNCGDFDLLFRLVLHCNF